MALNWPAPNQSSSRRRRRRAQLSNRINRDLWKLSAGFPRRLALTSLRSDFYLRMIERLVQARKEAGITQAELGLRIGQRQTFVSKVELMERRLDVAEFVEICRALAVEPMKLINEADDG